MQTLAIYIIKTIASSGILYLYYLLALRNKKFHSYNRFYILASIMLSIFVPLLHLQLFVFNSSSDKAVHMMNVIYTGNLESAVVVRSFSNILSWMNFAWLSFCVICAIHFITLLTRIIQLRQLKQHYPLTQFDDITLVETDLKEAPFSFMQDIFWRNDIDLETRAGKQILQHEMTHIKQKHTYDKLFMQSVLCLFWMQPFFWLFRKELYMVHEFIADENAVGNDAEAFAFMLLSNSFNSHVLSPAQSFSYSPIKRRLVMISTSKEPRFSYVRRLMVLPLLAATVIMFSFTLKKEKHNTNDGSSWEYHGKHFKNCAIDATKESVTLTFDDGKVQTITLDEAVKENIVKRTFNNTDALKHANGIDTAIIINDSSKALYVIDGIPAANHNIDPSTIESMNILKGNDATALYGDMGRGGVIIITTKEANAKKYRVSGAPQIKADSVVFVISDSTRKQPLYVINGVVQDNNFALKTINPSNIKSINVLKDETAITKYGSKASEGVVEITLKDDSYTTILTTDILASKVDVVAKFPGGNDAWLKYLMKNLNANTPVDHGARAGMYTAVVSFLVDPEGNISEVKADKDPGYGCGVEAVRIIQQGPKWIAAELNGKKVTYRQKQSITFQVAEDKPTKKS